ncbi:MAG: DHH family phosphoesterase [Planctomycetota bacterium]|nr:DHH family phosphoesterase [Planctomycetota bacterium]
MQEAIQLIESSQKILLSGHLRADGDCLGAQSVMYHALKKMGKEVEVMLPNPPDGRYGFLEAHTPWTLFNGTLPKADLLLVCDCNQLNRLGSMGDAVAASGMPRIALDHHPIAEDHGWTALVHDVTAAASGLIALKVASALGVDSLPIEAYEAAFVALMTDTGWLKYSNADADAWAAAASLVEKGVNTERLYDLVYQQAELGRPIGISAALENLQYFEDGRIAVAFSSQARLAELGGTLEDSDDILDILRSVKEVEAVGLITERAGGFCKVSFRSKRHLDVNQVARTIGGGGHARAAGASFAQEVSLASAVSKVAQALLDGYAAQKVAAALNAEA